LILVDTPAQLDVVHQDRGARYSVRDYVAAHSANRAIRVRFTTEFETSRDEVDVAFCVAVFDVVPPATRQKILNLSDVVRRIVVGMDTGSATTTASRSIGTFVIPRRSRESSNVLASNWRQTCLGTDKSVCYFVGTVVDART
jgi:hypothetical protein